MFGVFFLCQYRLHSFSLSYCAIAVHMQQHQQRETLFAIMSGLIHVQFFKYIRNQEDEDDDEKKIQLKLFIGSSRHARPFQNTYEMNITEKRMCVWHVSGGCSLSPSRFYKIMEMEFVKDNDQVEFIFQFLLHLFVVCFCYCRSKADQLIGVGGGAGG